jgi:xanthine dehydrogenase FAD-binding subunit
MRELELLSIRNIKELETIKILDDKTISIGSMATFSSIHRNSIVNQYIPVLAEAAVSMGGPQIRNIATIGGNICNGAVSADSAPTLFALNAKLRLESLNGGRIIPIHEFYAGPGRVKFEPSEVLTHILIEKEDYEGIAGNYIKFSNRKAMDIAMLSVVALGKIEDNTIIDLRIALGVAAPTPVRCKVAEEYAKGKPITNELIQEIGEKTLENAMPRNSWRGSKAYREHLIKELSKRALNEVIKRSGGNGDE